MTSSRTTLSLSAILLVSGGAFIAARSLRELSGDRHAASAAEASLSATLSGAPNTLDSEGETIAEVDAPYGAWIGVEFEYHAEFESKVEVMSGDSTQGIHHLFSGRQLVKIVERTHESIIASYSWPELELELIEDGIHSRPEETRALTEELSLPVLVYFDLNGTQQALRFTSGVNATTRNWARNLIACQNAPIKIKEHTPLEYDLIEADASGLSLVHFKVSELLKDEAKVSRTKLEAIDGMAWRDGEEPLTVSGEGVITLSSGWTLGVEWRERSTIELDDAKLRIDQVFNAKIDRVSVRNSALGSMHDREFEEEWRSLDGLSESTERPPPALTELDSALLSDANAEAVLSYLVALERANDHSAKVMLAVDQLALLISQDPETLRMIRRALSSSAFSDWTTTKVLAAVAAAGDARSQALLCDLLSTPELPADLYEAVTLALSQLETVRLETIDFFWKTLSDDDSPNDLRHSSWLLLGLFASTDADSQLVDDLINMEAAALAAEELVPWLGSLGNTHNSAVFETLRVYLFGDDVNARLHAVRALSYVNHLETTPTLIELSSIKYSPIVRQEALALLSTREEIGALRALGELLRLEPEFALRRSTLEALAKRSMDKELLILLSTVATSDPDTALRAYALTLLGS